MDVAGFIMDIIMEIISLYLAIFFLRSYSRTRNSKFIVLGGAFLIFFIVDLIESIGVNVYKMRFFEDYYVHDIIVILGMLALVYAVSSPPSWKMKLASDKEKKVA